VSDVASKVIVTLITVVIAVAGSAGIWIGANLLFNQVRHHWNRFSAIAYGAAGFIGGAIISGNRLIQGSGEGDNKLAQFASWVWFPIVAAAASAVIGLLLAMNDDPPRRFAIGVGGFGGLGLIVGVLLRSEWRPEISIVALVGWTVAVAAIGAGLSVLRKRPPVGGALVGAALGWVVGAFGAPDLGSGNAGWAIVACVVPPALIGVRLAMNTNPDLQRRGLIDQRSRAVIFLGPALLFIFATLVIPAIRTIYLSFLDDRGEEGVGFDNYQATFTDPVSWDMSDWTNMFTSAPFIIGLVLLAGFVFLGLKGRQLSGKMVELGSPSMGPLVVGGLFVAFGVFTALRGTIINNLWWVIVVTAFSTGLGLAVAVLADNAKFERVAKSIIFMPMAISLVGASVIWRFMYVARDNSKEQTGVMNAMWVGLGRLSTGQEVAATAILALIILGGFGAIVSAASDRNWAKAGIGLAATVIGVVVVNLIWNALSPDAVRVVVGALLTLLFIGLLVPVARSLTSGRPGRAVLPGVIALLLGWFLIRYWAIIGTGVGGHRVDDETGEVLSGQAINFVQEGPYNNFWLMVVLIWIQTGFAMVILSAAIKAVPTEFIEAARVDGATDSQIFWRITLPQIGTTIGVVVTTLIVLVMKVYDIVKVMTNGNFGTQVLANDMFQQAFQFNNIGRGASLAVLILVSVLPVMVFNIRKMQREL
jgi:alpha-glucoside transport system permease protein